MLIPLQAKVKSFEYAPASGTLKLVVKITEGQDALLDRPVTIYVGKEWVDKIRVAIKEEDK